MPRPWLGRALGVGLLILLAGAGRAVAGGLPAAPTPLAPGRAPAPVLAASLSSVSQNPADGVVPYGVPVAVTASLSGAAGAFEYVYLRYSTDNFTTCQLLAMGEVLGSARTRFVATIPNLVLTAAPATVRYSVFTSSTLPGLATCSNATVLALDNNGGANYAFNYGVKVLSLSVPAAPTSCDQLITAQLAATPAALGENFYLRYPTNAGASSQTVAMLKAGATATAVVPAQAPGTTVSYHAFSSTALTPAATEGASPAPVLRTSAASSFTTPAALSISALTAGNATCANGNNGEVTFTVGGGVPGSYAFELATNGGPFQPATATKPPGDERYHIGGLVAGSRYQVRIGDCGPAVTAPNSVTVSSSNPIMSATLSNGGPVCTGGSTTVSFLLEGTAPWSLTYTDGLGNTISRTGITTKTFTLSTGVLAANRTYALTQLSDANGCAAQSLPLSTTVAVNAKPTSTTQLLTPSVCAGNNATLTGTLTGAGPWTVFYTTTGNPEPQTVGLGLAGQTSFNYTFNTAALTVGGPNTITITITTISDASCLAFPNSAVTVNVTGGTVWTGSKSSEWSNEGNWTNCIPSQYLDARIPALTNGNPYPSYTSGQTAAEVRNLTIEAGARLTYTAGTLALYGNLTNNGALRLTQGTGVLGLITGAVVSLNGSTSQTIRNLGEVYDLVVNTSGSATATLSGDV